jgi:hypothetical protein
MQAHDPYGRVVRSIKRVFVKTAVSHRPISAADRSRLAVAHVRRRPRLRNRDCAISGTNQTDGPP